MKASLWPFLGHHTVFQSTDESFRTDYYALIYATEFCLADLDRLETKFQHKNNVF